MDPRLPERSFPALQHYWVADQRSRADLTRSVQSAMLWNAAAWVLYALVAVLVVLQFLLSVVLGVFALTVFAFVFGTMFVGAHWYIKRAVGAMVPLGATWASGFGPDSLVLVSPMATSVLDYSAIVSARRAGAVVICRLKGDAMYEIIPGILVPDQELHALRSRISARQSPPNPPEPAPH
ncbi:hypothetical protein [Tsukamurella pseudospumae]|uniref:DUF304 domain-containing protein n=1 Tax=Tsukamurella pseudospumae TaxID=239498 RepID=A0A137ZRG2_9ACTN|nr:hypothetical protein [Tsukamurella pseudospumae]KXP00768.1 hypothetical protein AXK61_14335 [Tsukamurella pseudospumae]